MFFYGLMDLLIVILLIGLGISHAWIYQNQLKILERLEKQESKRIFSLPKSTPNNIAEQGDVQIIFDENNPLDLPKDIKVEIEGGDAVTPPGFEQVNQ